MNPDPFSVSYKNLARKSHMVGHNKHHIYWCTKYRYNMMRQSKYKSLLEAILRDIAREHKIEILSLTVAPQHVHIITSLPFSMSQSKALQLFKGGSSYRMFRANEHFRLRYPKGHFWSPGKFARSVSDVDLQTVVNYVERHNEKQASLGCFGA
jgi:putative transposase